MIIITMKFLFKHIHSETMMMMMSQSLPAKKMMEKNKAGTDSELTWRGKEETVFYRI